MQDGLTKCSAPAESLWALDWQHTCYRLRPDLRGKEQWPLSPYPDGDYYIYLADDLRFGTFGHPWEHTLCVFGAELLDEIEEKVGELLQRVVRRDGQPVR
ncbi:hypothetical protein GCM10018790_73950 [Kitasatospora xanthocidica]|nr:hypothetical protein GCM10018790_73950 [Kitasatospora xanthocidica]